MNKKTMSYFRKKLERRTFSQDRYYILIKRQKAGKATFNELTELDEIVNRVPDIREKVLIENFFTEKEDDTNESSNHPLNEGLLHNHPIKHHSFLGKVKSFFHRILASQIAVKTHEFNFLY
jgi:hypothetical protein